MRLPFGADCLGEAEARMPTPDPDSQSLIAGKEWHIEGAVLDREGKPLNLTDASIGWALLDQSDAPVVLNAVVSVLDPPANGIITIELSAQTTGGLAPGLYTEELQITVAGRTSIIRGLSIIVVAKSQLSS